MNTLHQAWTVIEASAPMRAFRAHRHVLLAPAFLVMVSLMFGRATMHAPVGALPSSAAAGGVSSGVDIGNGAIMIPSADATYGVDREVDLHAGSVLVTSDGLATVRFSSSGSLSGWNGGFFALRDERALTVAAITTPVVVRMGSGVLLLPVGMQWSLPLASVPSSTGADLTAFLHGILPGPLPRSFVEEQRKKLAALHPASVDGAPAAPVTLAGVLSGTAVIVDPAEEEHAARVATLVRTVTDGADDEALALLQSHPDVVQGADGQRLLARLLAANLSIALRSALLDAVTDADMQLLLAVHPVRRFEGLLFFDGASADRRALLLSLPIVDTQSEPLPEFLLTRFAEELVPAVEQAQDRSAELTALLAAIERGVREQRSRQFVHRMAVYAHAAQALVERFEATATLEQRALLASITQLAKPPIPVLPKAEVYEAQSSSVAPLTAVQTQELQTAVRAMLVAKGALFTKRTELRAVSHDAVHVSGVAFATPNGDELFSFTVDPQTAVLSSIVRDGKESSFPVSLEKFLEWISAQ